jgi:hypothetical protein
MVVPLHVMTAAGEPAACSVAKAVFLRVLAASIGCAEESTPVAMWASYSGILAVKFQESSTALY